MGEPVLLVSGAPVEVGKAVLLVTGGPVLVETGLEVDGRCAGVMTETTTLAVKPVSKFCNTSGARPVMLE